MSEANIWTPAHGERYWAPDAAGVFHWNGDAVDLQRQRDGLLFSSTLAAGARSMGLEYFEPGDILPDHATALRYERAMKRVQVQYGTDRWGAFDPADDAAENVYRLAPVREAFLELPEPMRRAPAVGAEVWIVSQGKREWEGTPEDFQFLYDGLCHATYSEYRATFKALISVLRGR